MILRIEWDCSTILGADWLGFQHLGIHRVSKSSGCFHDLRGIFFVQTLHGIEDLGTFLYIIGLSFHVDFNGYR